MNARTNPPNSGSNIIQPVRRCVPAGFSVFKTGEIPEVFLYVEKGELVASQKNENNESIELFRVHEKEIVGVPTLIEKEPLPYDITAITDTEFLQIDEECLTSALKASPVWLLAATRQIVLHTKKAKTSVKKSLCQNKARALAEFLYMQAEVKIANGEVAIFQNIRELLNECSWLSKVPVNELAYELSSLERKHMVLLHDGNLGIQKPELLKAFAEYQTSLERGEDFPPFHMNLTEKRCLSCIAREPLSTVLEGSDWLKLLQGNDKFATVAEVIMLENSGILQKTEFGQLAINQERLHWFILCQKHEADIKGVI